MWTGCGLPFKKTILTDNYGFCDSRQSCLPSLPWSYPDFDVSKLSVADNESLEAVIVTIAGPEGDWHKEPDTGQYWPVRFFPRIAFPPGNPVGDIQRVWERSRLQNLITLGLICRVTQHANTQHLLVQMLEKRLLSWIDENPWLWGIHYISTMECALRLISICHAFDLIRNQKVSLQAWQGVVYLVHSHAYFIRRRLCLYSYAGNHTLGECAGLIYAGLLFPELPDAQEWLQTGLNHMEREASVQILADGGNREQSFRYLAMMVDLCGLVTALLKHYDKSAPDGIEQAWIRGSSFLRAFATSPDSLPVVGDSDDGYALSRYLRLSWQPNIQLPKSFCRLLKNVFEAADVRQKQEKKRSLCLINEHFEPVFNTTAATQIVFQRSARDRLQVFEASGFSKTQGETVHGNMRFTHGQLGTARGFGHGHADALSVCWNLGDKPILVDPGTYLYDRDPHFRRYFRGTSAHNTIIVDAFDQALQNSQTSFGWLQPYRAELVWRQKDLEGRILLLACHNGYAGMGVTHWRALIYDRRFGWAVWDCIHGTGVHHLAMHWHVDAPIERSGGGWMVDCASQPWFIHIEGGESVCYRGNEDLPLGWISRKYASREPINTIKAEIRTQLPHEFLTIISPQQVTPTELFIDGTLIQRLRNHCKHGVGAQVQN